MPPSAEVVQCADELAHAFAELENAEENDRSAYFDFACASLALRRIRQAQVKLMADHQALYDATVLKQLLALKGTSVARSQNDAAQLKI